MSVYSVGAAFCLLSNSQENSVLEILNYHAQSSVTLALSWPWAYRYMPPLVSVTRLPMNCANAPNLLVLPDGLREISVCFSICLVKVDVSMCNSIPHVALTFPGAVNPIV